MSDFSSSGIPPRECDNWTNVETSEATALEVFTGRGWILGVTIWKDVDGGTLQFKNTAGTALFPSGMTDYVGGFPIPAVLCPAGCTITTTSFATSGGKLTVWWTKKI